MSISKILSYIVLAVGVISGVLLYLMNTSFTKLMNDAGADEARELPLELSAAAVSPLYNLALVVIAVLVVATLITVISSLIKNPSSLKKTAIGIAAFAVVIIVAYVTSTGQETITRDGEIITAGTSKWVGAGLKSFYFLAVIAIISMIVAGVKKTISN